MFLYSEFNVKQCETTHYRNNKADLEDNMSSAFLLSVSLDPFSSCFMVKIHRRETL